MSREYIYQRIRDGSLRHHRFGGEKGEIRIAPADLDAFIASRARGGPPAEATPAPKPAAPAKKAPAKKAPVRRRPPST